MVRETAQSSPPLPFIQSSCSASSHSVATAGVLYVWSLPELSTAVARSSDGGIHRSDPAISATRASAAGDNSAEPQPAVGAEVLLRGEVVDVGLRHVDRQPAGARGRVDEHQRRRRSGRATGRHHAGGGLVVRPRVRVDARLRAQRRRAAGVGPDHHRLAQERRARGHVGELRGELAEHQVLGPLAAPARTPPRPRTRSRRRCRAPPRTRPGGRTGSRAPPGPGAPGS